MESVAQVGVQLLLFTLGLEFSLSKLRAVRSVALAGAPHLLHTSAAQQQALPAHGAWMRQHAACMSCPPPPTPPSPADTLLPGTIALA